MKTLIWENGQIKLAEKPYPKILDNRDAIVKVTLSSICTSDLHIKHGFVPAAKNGIALGHEFVGEVVEIGSAIENIKVGDRVSGNVETFCGECFFCKRGFINNCEHGGWHLGCKIDGAQAEYIRVPFADMGLNKLPENVSYKNALFVGDVLASGYFGAELCEISSKDTVAIIGSGPVGLCTMASAKVMGAKKIIAIDIDSSISISPNEYSGLISFRFHWFDLAVQGTLKSLLQYHNSKASMLWCSVFFMIQLSHLYMTTGKTIALTMWTFVGKVIYLLFNTLSRFVIGFLPRSKRLLISWL